MIPPGQSTVQAASLPPELEPLLDAELSSGNTVAGMEIGQGSDTGKVTMILAHQFQTDGSGIPRGVIYRETEVKGRRAQILTTAGERFSLMVIDPKPKPPPQPDAKPAYPSDPPRKTRVKKSAPVRPAPKTSSPQSDPARRFLASMNLSYDQWKEGEGYDLKALDEVTDQERDEIEKLLIGRANKDWRDLEALARLATPAALKAIRKAQKDSDPKIQLAASRHLDDGKLTPAKERAIINGLTGTKIFYGFTQAIDAAAEHPTPKIKAALFKVARDGDGDVACHCAALLFYLHGKSKMPFDWDHRPFFLRFNETDTDKRRAVFLELCSTLGVDPKKVC
jgi:hypothetical protein